MNVPVRRRDDAQRFRNGVDIDQVSVEASSVTDRSMSLEDAAVEGAGERDRAARDLVRVVGREFRAVDVAAVGADPPSP